MIRDNEPLISIIIPVYNVAAYLDSSLRTVVSQTYQNLEIILVNDGSGDGSGELCDRWAETDSRIRVIHQSNKGPSAARNAALDAAAGDYILFADSDDLLHPDLCRMLMDAMTPDINITMCDIVHVYPDRSWTFSLEDGRSVLPAEEVIRQMWYQTGFLPGVWAKLYRKEVFSGIRFAEGLIFEDIYFLHELYWAAEKIAYLPSRLYGYLHRENSITTMPFSKKNLDILKVVDVILRFSEDKPDLKKAAQAYAISSAFRICLNAPETPEYREGILQSEAIIQRYGAGVLRDKNIRRKNRYALLLYFMCKPLLHTLYKYVNRWE